MPIWGNSWLCWGAWLLPASPSPPPRLSTHSTGRPGTPWHRGNKTVADSGALVAVIMGSKSDWETMRQADEMLPRFGVAHECRVLSAHRTPVETAEYVSQAEGRGIEVIIAAAGGEPKSTRLNSSHL